MKHLLAIALLSSVPLAAQSAPAPASLAPAAPQSSELTAEASQLADIAVRVRDEIAKMKKFELSVKALRGAADVEALAKKMRAQSTSATSATQR